MAGYVVRVRESDAAIIRRPWLSCRVASFGVALKSEGGQVIRWAVIGDLPLQKNSRQKKVGPREPLLTASYALKQIYNLNRSDTTHAITISSGV